MTVMQNRMTTPRRLNEKKHELKARKVWKAAKTTKDGSPYHYLGDAKKRGQTPEDIVEEALKKNICNRQSLSALPNPKQYALHIPTVQYDCDNVLEEHGAGFIDALSTGEDITPVCWDLDICGSSDPLYFDFVEEDADDDPDL